MLCKIPIANIKFKYNLLIIITSVKKFREAIHFFFKRCQPPTKKINGYVDIGVA